MKEKIAFIGAGNLATSLIGGLIQEGRDPKSIWASNKNKDQCERLSADFGIHVTQDNSEAVKQAEVIVLAVKPTKLAEVSQEISGVVKLRKPLVISVAAGVRLHALSKWLDDEQVALVRAMPNTPALLRCAATGLFAEHHVTQRQRSMAQVVFEAIGLVVWLDKEEQIDTVTAVSGSGPAYFFMVMEAMQAAGEALGLSYEESRQLVLQTALGAAKMASASSKDVATLRRQVTSPNGTTESAINALEKAQLRKIFYTAMESAKNRAQEIGDTFN